MYTTKAFILGRRERGEADYQFLLFTESFGYISATAQGVRKARAKLKGHLEPLTKTEVSLVQAKSGYRLTHALVDNALQRARSNPVRLSCLTAAAVILSTISFEGRDPAIWEYLSQFTRYLNREKNIFAEEALLWFLTRLLLALGYQLSEDESLVAASEERAIIAAYETSGLKEAMSSSLPAKSRDLAWRVTAEAFRRHHGCHFLFLKPGLS